MTPITVLYHANCADGFCAAWVAHRAMREQAAAGLVSSHPVRYGDELPEIPEDGTVFLLDFSLKAEAFHLLVERTKRVVVLDHHKTALAELSFPENTFKHRPLNDRPDIFIDVNKSGGRLAWEYFFPSEPSPFLVDYTEDRDLWRWRLEDSREINEALGTVPFDFGEWDAMLQNASTIRRLKLGGQWLLAAKQNRIASAVANAFEVELFGYRVLCANVSCDQSEVAGALAKGRPFGACFTDLPNGRVYSLRSTPDGVDVSELAASVGGGGGHKHAAGFSFRSR